MGAVAEEGLIELKLVPAHQAQSYTIFSMRTDALRGSTSADDKTLMLELPKSKMGVKYLGYIEIHFTPDASDTLDYTDCSMRIDVTWKYPSGRYVKGVLDLKDFGMTTGAEVAHVAATPVRIGRYQNDKPETTVFLGQNEPNGYIMINLMDDTA